MRQTHPPSRHLDPTGINAPAEHGAVAWGQFNASFEALLTRDWRRVNEGTAHPWWLRVVRLALAYGQSRNQSILDLAGKARVLSRLPLRRDPDIVFFGAEVGWEAFLLRALFGDGGRLWLIDDDAAAYARFQNAPRTVKCRAPSGHPKRLLTVQRDEARVTYVRQDFFAVEPPPDGFDVGIDWGLLEHFDDARKPEVLRCFGRFVRPGGLQLSSTPRDRWLVRLFYRAFADELNFGYRELMHVDELTAHLRRAGREIVLATTLPAHNVVVSRTPDHGAGRLP